MHLEGLNDHGDTVIVCENDLNVSDEEADSKDTENAFGIISLIFYVISMICVNLQAYTSTNHHHLSEQTRKTPSAISQ